MEPTPRHVQRIAISLLTAGGLVVGGFVAAAPTADTGIGVRALMRRVGQPWQRLGRELTYCAKEPGEEAGADERRAVPRRQGDGRRPRLSSQRRLHDGLR